MTTPRERAADALATTVAELLDDIREAMPTPPRSPWWGPAESLTLALAIYDSHVPEDEDAGWRPVVDAEEGER